MDHIFFEKQEGNLCAQHALNALLQSQIFSVLELAEIARRLDAVEAALRTGEESVGKSAEGTTNMDDSGFFSLQVIQEALQVFGLELVNYSGSTETAIAARSDPTAQSAFICNFKEHWFCIRKLGLQWFNLNSVLKGPELVSDTYLKLFLAQLGNEGYDIYIVVGSLPECVADDWLLCHPVDPKVAQQRQQQSASASSNVGEGEEDAELQEALALSRAEANDNDPSLNQVLSESTGEVDDAEMLRQAVQMSLQSAAPTTVSPATLRRNRENFLQRLEQKGNGGSNPDQQPL